MTARCIGFSDGRRCPRNACKGAGDLYLCRNHSTMWTMLLIDDMLAPATRRMLALARWETVAAGQALIDRMYKREAA